jgi:hypothetical protein
MLKSRLYKVSEEGEGLTHEKIKDKYNKCNTRNTKRKV